MCVVTRLNGNQFVEILRLVICLRKELLFDMFIYFEPVYRFKNRILKFWMLNVKASLGSNVKPKWLFQYVLCHFKTDHCLVAACNDKTKAYYCTISSQLLNQYVMQTGDT